MQKINFPIAVFQQPKESFGKFFKEGVNLVIEPSQSNNDTPQVRRSAAAAAGLFYIDVPSDANDCLQMVNDAACYGVCIPDESSNYAPWYSGDPVGFKNYADAFISKWNAILAPARGKKPVFGNFAGGHILGARPWSQCNQIAPFASICDILGFDVYPFENYVIEWDNWNAGKGLPISLNDSGKPDPLAVNTTEQQYAMKLLKAFLPNKPIWGYLQTTQFDASPGGRPVEPNEIDAQVNPLLKEGLAGVAYFTHKFNGPGWGNPGAPAGGSNWDGRSQPIVNACIGLNQKLNATTTVPVSDVQKQLDEIKARLVALESKKVPSGVQLVY